MKNTMKEFFAKCENLFRREKAQPDSPGMVKYREFFFEELAWVKKNPELAAHIFASDRFDNMIRDDERDWAERHKDSVSSDEISVGNESERHQRAEQMIEMGKSYSPPAAENSPQRDGPELGDD